MSARPTDQPRLDLENILAILLGAEEELRPAALRLTSRLRSRDEREIADMINGARCAIWSAIANLKAYHPNGA